MKRIIQRKKITTRTPIDYGSQTPTYVNKPTNKSRRTDRLLERVAIPEESSSHEETIIEQDAEFLGLFDVKRCEKKLTRELFINDHIETELIKENTGCIKAVMARDETIYEQEKVLPELIKSIQENKNKILNDAFMEKFYMPDVRSKNRSVTLLQHNERAEMRLEWLEHKLLEAQAIVLQCGDQWLFHLKLQHMLFRLSPHEWRLRHDTVHVDWPRCHDPPLHKFFSLPNLSLLPSLTLESLLQLFQQESSRSPNLELYFSKPEQLIKPMELLELKGQIKNKNTIYMEDKLSEQKKLLQDLKEKTEHVYANLKKEYYLVEKDLTKVKNERGDLENQSRALVQKTFETSLSWQSKLAAFVAVDSLMEAVLHCEGSSAHNMCCVLERKVQSVLSELFQLMREDDPPQNQFEAEWIKSEERSLKVAKEAYTSVLRMNKLEERLNVALAPPYKKVKRKIPPAMMKKKSKIKDVSIKPSPFGVENSYCFDKEVDMKQATYLYRPAPGLLEEAVVENPLLKSWEAVSGFVPSADTTTEEIIRPRKSTESILDLLDSRSSYDFIISTSSDSIGSAVRRDSVVYDSDEDTSSSSDAIE